MEHIEDRAVRAAGAHDRRADRDRLGGGGRRGRFNAEHGPGDHLRGVLAAKRKDVLTDHVQPELPAVVFDERVELLDDIGLFVLCAEVAQHLIGQRVHGAELQVIGLIAERLFGIEIADAARDHADRGAVFFHAVDLRRLGPERELLLPLLDERVHAAGVRRQGHAARVLDVRRGLVSFRLPELHERLRVRNAGRKAHEDRRVEVLAHMKRQVSEVLALLGVRGLEHEHLGRLGIVPGVLLVLRGVHARVVGHAEDEAARRREIARGEDRVRHHVETHVLHAAHRAAVGERRADGDLGRDFFIRGPLDVDVGIGDDGFGDLGARRARVRGHHVHARLKGAARDGRVADQ